MASLEAIELVCAKEREVEFFTHPLSQVRLENSWVTLDGERFFVTETARRMLAEGLGMPVAFVLQLSLQLQALLFNFMIERTVARAHNKPPSFVRFAVRGDMVVAAAINPKSSTTSLSSTLTKIFEVIPEEWTEMEPMVHRWCWSPQKAEVQLIFQQVSSEPRPGDIVAGGILVRVSPIGLRAPTVDPFLLRLVCSNGMVVPERLCTKTNGDRRKNGSDFLQSAERAWRTLSEVMRRLLDLAQERVDVEAEVVTIARDLRLSTALRRALLNALERDELGNHGTLLDVVNAVSRVATHHDRLNDAVRHRLMRAAGLLLQGEHRCPTCRRIWLRPVGDEM
jgi:hypothetical protein